MDARVKPGHDEVRCRARVTANALAFGRPGLIISPALT
jgi:hypothetical protein